MLSKEQREYLDILRTNYPTLDEGALRQALSGAQWPEEQIIEGLNYFHSKNLSSPPVTIAQEADVVSPLHDVHSKRRAHFFAIIVIGVLIFGGTFVALGYYIVTQTTLFDPPPLTNENILSSVVMKLGEINTVNYSAEAGIAVVPRENGAMAFSMAVPATAEVLQKYQRDQDRFRDIADIRSVLSTQYYQQDQLLFSHGNSGAKYSPKINEYPRDISGLVKKTEDPLGVSYGYARTLDGKGYTLTVTFETQEAVDVATGKGLYGSQNIKKEQVNGKTVTISTNDYLATYNFKGKPTQPKFLGVFDLGQLEAFLPNDLSGKLSVGGTLEVGKESPSDARMQISGALSFGDGNFAFDAEGRKKGATYFGIINKLPTFFSSMSQLRGKWVSLTEEDLKNYGYTSFYDSLVPSEANERKLKIEKVRMQWKTLLTIAREEGLVAISAPVEKVIEGNEQLSKYKLTLVKEKILPFYERATTELASYGKDSILPRDEKTLEYLKGNDFSLIAEYLKNSATMSLWIDRKGFPVKGEFVVRYVPSDEARALKDKQIDFTLLITLKDINKPVIVDVPKESITFDDLMVEITGKSKEELKLEQQAANVAKLKGAINQYYEWTGVYPEKLVDLKKLHKDVPHTPASTTNAIYSSGFNMDEYYKELPFLKNIPIDIYTKQEFPYRSYMSGAPMYDFTYMMEIPPYKGTVNPSIYAFAEAVGEYGSANGKMLSREENKKRGMTLTPRFVNGKNTATKSSHDISIEAQAYSMIDQDVDGLPDMLEEYFGTDAAKKDTDGDGFSDAEELIKGSNPLGPGQLQYMSEPLHSNMQAF